MRRIDRDAGELARRERAIVANQGKVLAGVMAASVAHDANNVLTAVLGELGLLAAEGGADRESVDQMRAGVNRLAALNRRLVAAADQRGGDHGRVVDLEQTVREAIALFRPHLHLQGRSIEVRSGPPLAVRAEPLLLHQIVGNLLLNAAEAAGPSGSVRVALHGIADEAVIEVEDSGPGIAREQWVGLFDRLTTTKPEGAGLGLFSVRACTQSLGGSVEVGDSPLGGACFRVRLQCAAPVTA